MKVYTVAVEEYEEIEDAAEVMWSLSYVSLERAKLAAVEDMLELREADCIEEEPTGDWEDHSIRSNTIVLDDNQLCKGWTIMETDLR